MKDLMPASLSATELRTSRDAAIRALQLIAVTWAQHPSAETIAELKAAVRETAAVLRLVEHAERALANLERIEGRLAAQGCLDASERWLTLGEPLTAAPTLNDAGPHGNRARASTSCRVRRRQPIKRRGARRDGAASHRSKWDDGESEFGSDAGG